MMVARKTKMEKTLRKDLYVKDSWFEKECLNIFHKEWFCVARTEDLAKPGEYRVINLTGESIILIHGKDGVIRAFFNVCKHRGCQLLDDNDKEGASGNLINNIRCPYHSWTYNFDGSLLKAPHLKINIKDQQYHLNEIKTEIWGGFIFLKIGKNNIQLKNHLGNTPNQFIRYPIKDLISKVNIKYTIKANWKVIIENYNECYHCAGIHPELCKVVPAFKKNGGSNLIWEEGVPQRKGTNTYTFTGTTNRPPFPGLNAAEKERHFGQSIYPNLLISLSMDHIAAFIIFPVDSGKTIIDFKILFHPEAISSNNFDPNDAAEFWDTANIQDWNICERVQKGMQSISFKQGYYSPMEDENLDIRKYISEKLRVDVD